MSATVKKNLFIALINFVLGLVGVVLVTSLVKGVTLWAAFCAPFTWYLVVTGAVVSFASLMLRSRNE